MWVCIQCNLPKSHYMKRMCNEMKFNLMYASGLDVLHCDVKYVTAQGDARTRNVMKGMCVNVGGM